MSNDNKGYISDVIKWRYDVSSNMDTKSLFENLKQLDFEVKIEVPHFLQLNYLLSSYVQPVYVYYLNDMGFQLNLNGILNSISLELFINN